MLSAAKIEQRSQDFERKMSQEIIQSEWQLNIPDFYRDRRREDFAEVDQDFQLDVSLSEKHGSIGI